MTRNRLKSSRVCIGCPQRKSGNHLYAWVYIHVCALVDMRTTALRCNHDVFVSGARLIMYIRACWHAVTNCTTCRNNKSGPRGSNPTGSHHTTNCYWCTVVVCGLYCFVKYVIYCLIIIRRTSNSRSGEATNLSRSPAVRKGTPLVSKLQPWAQTPKSYIYIYIYIYICTHNVYIYIYIYMYIYIYLYTYTYV